MMLRTMRFAPIKGEKQQESFGHPLRPGTPHPSAEAVNKRHSRHLAEFGIVGPNPPHKIGLLTVVFEDEIEARIRLLLRRILRRRVRQLQEIRTKLVDIEQHLGVVAKKSRLARD